MINGGLKIGIVGLGYVGLPLAKLFATRYPVIGFDIDSQRVRELREGTDRTGEVDSSQLRSVLKTGPTADNGLYCTDLSGDMAPCDHYIITVPTPVDGNHKPDMQMLFRATRMVGALLVKGDTVIYESTVYPGATEEECVPLLERESGLIFNSDFFVGYSPERINPGDREHTVDKVVKITSGSDPATGDRVDALYRSVVTGGTYRAPSIKVAEAAKVIENSQRDINIAFVNELAKIFNLMGIDTHEVLRAAGTKWNFLPFVPGLVGGHCIGVDPYYLAQKAQSYGYHPEIILAGRRINDGMGHYIAAEVVKLMLQKDLKVRSARILVLGITFKENCTDVRNTKVVDLIRGLQDYGTEVTVYDPWADPEEVRQQYGISCHREVPSGTFGAVVLTVAHREFLGMDLRPLQDPLSVVYDVKGVLTSGVTGRL